MTNSTPTSVAPPRRRSSPATDLALVTTFAAVIGVCAVLPAINGVASVPFTLQMFGVFLAGAVLGAKRGFAALPWTGDAALEAAIKETTGATLRCIPIDQSPFADAAGGKRVALFARAY